MDTIIGTDIVFDPDWFGKIDMDCPAVDTACRVAQVASKVFWRIGEGSGIDGRSGGQLLS